MTIRLTRGEHDYDVTVEPAGAGFLVTLGGTSLLVEGVIGPRLRARVGSRPVEAAVSHEGDTIVIEVGGRAYEFRERSARAPRLAVRARTHGGRRGELHAPMPGLVVDVLAGVGEEVEAGRPVVVVEAMKMQNALAAPISGRVTSVSVIPGTAVESGQLLLVIEPGAA
jgi:3-methylcrotonyl-CoA carboxylase alpha subunit